MADASCCDLEERLVRLSERLEFPPEPPLAASVRARIERESRRGGRSRSRWMGRFVLVATCLVGVLLVLSPGSRRAVAGFLGLDGIVIGFREAPPTPLGDDLLLGKRVSLEQARAVAGFDVAVPAALGGPDEVYVSDDRPGARVSLLYATGRSLPETAETRVGVLIGQFRATSNPEYVVKNVIVERGYVEAVEVGGVTGYWLGGGPHTLSYVDAYGALREDRVRLAGNTLVWQRDGVVYRLESALTKREAVRIAHSM